MPGIAASPDYLAPEKSRAARGLPDAYLAGTMSAMNKVTPFLWFDDNAEEAATFYLSVFPDSRRLDEVRSKGVGPWASGKIAMISIELQGQEMVFLNGGPTYQINPAFSFFVRVILNMRSTATGTSYSTAVKLWHAAG